MSSRGVHSHRAQELFPTPKIQKVTARRWKCFFSFFSQKHAGSWDLPDRDSPDLTSVVKKLQPFEVDEMLARYNQYHNLNGCCPKKNIKTLIKIIARCLVFL